MLTNNHQRYIHSLLSHIESEVQEGIANLDGADPASLFPRYVDYPDAKRIDALRVHLARLRSVIRRFMDAQGMANTETRSVNASWAFQTRMALASNAVFELRPNYVRGYGELDEQGEQDCRALSAELSLLLDDISRELRQQPLLLPSDRAKDELLAALVDAIERHQLLELRSSVQSLLAVNDGDRVEVAMLGRVSSGKSSLVNALLGQALLPVGAIPVTAVVTRIRHGETLQIKAVDIEGRVQDIALDELPNYIAESGNADNHLRLREVTIEVPSEILRDGIVVTDTPGLGSLHLKASAHALTYLPRCDLGIITIDASATLSTQDMDLARALQQAHASRLVLLTKSDTVSAEALEQQRSYIEKSLTQALQEPVTVAEVSVAAEQAGALERWRETSFRDALNACAKEHEVRARRRLADLGRRVCVVLEQALKEQSASVSTASSPSTSGNALATLSDIESSLRTLASDLGYRGAEVVLNDALSALPAANESSASSHIQVLAGQLADEVVRDMVTGLKRAATGIDAEQAASMMRGAPPFVLQLPDVPRYALRGPRAWRRHVLRKRLDRDFQTPLQNAFLAYGRELKNWLVQVSHLLRRALGSDVLATQAATGDAASLSADLAHIRALMDTSTTPSA